MSALAYVAKLSTLAALLTLAIAAPRTACAQRPGVARTNSPPAAHQTRPISQDSEAAKAAYYLQLTRELSLQSATKGFWDNVLGVLGFVGAFIATIVAFVSFVYNYRATLRSQRDTQFYEALKRFGDKDSPAVRASAAGLLAQMAQVQTDWNVPGFEPNARLLCLRTTIDQFAAGLVLEENGVVIAAIVDAIRGLAPSEPDYAIGQLYGTNLRLQRAMLLALAGFFAFRRRMTTDADPAKDLSDASPLTGYNRDVLATLIESSDGPLSRDPDFGSLFDAAAVRISIAGKDGLAQQGITATETLRLAAERLRSGAEALACALRARRVVSQPSAVPAASERAAGPLFVDEDPGNVLVPGTNAIVNGIRIPLEESRGHGGVKLQSAFLVGTDLRGVNLAGADLTGAQVQFANVSDANLAGANLRLAKLQRTDFRGATLSDAWFDGASLKGAGLEDARLDDASLVAADLTDTFLGGAFFERTKLHSANWWKARFSARLMAGRALGTYDIVAIVRELYRTYRDAVPADPEQLNAEWVRGIVERERQPNSAPP